MVPGAAPGRAQGAVATDTVGGKSGMTFRLFDRPAAVAI